MVKTKILKRNLIQSEKYWQRAREIIPCGTQTLSKGPTQFVQGVAPKYLKKGKGCHVWDVDGNEYIDYGMGCHSVNLGYAYPVVNEAIMKQLDEGINFTLMHPLEVGVSELLIKTIPCAEMVRFGKNGSDVTSAAVRVARAYTGRDRIACCGYHGWQDWYVATTERNKGIPHSVKELTHAFIYNDIESLKRIFTKYKGEIAAVIMEPVGIVEPQNNFLEKVKRLTHQNGAVLIFDEIITGFRLSLGGAQEYFGVIPDLAAFGKAMANGMPLSAIVGKKEVMNYFNNVFFSFTFGGEALSLAASLATIKEIKDKKVIDYIWRQGKRLQDGYNRLAKDMGLKQYTQCIGYPPRAVMFFKDSTGCDSLEIKTLFQQEMIKRGILFSAGNVLSYSHGDKEIDKTLKVYEEVLRVVKTAVKGKNIKKYLEGKVVCPVFRKP